MTGHTDQAPPGDQAAQSLFLRRAQCFLLARTTAPPPSCQNRLAALRRYLDPATDKPAVHPHCCGRFDPRLARSYHRHRDAAQLRLRRWRQFAKISFGYHPGHIARQPGNATFLTLGLVIECPVAGAPLLARDGNLVGFVGGTETDFERARPALQELCRSVDYFGPL